MSYKYYDYIKKKRGKYLDYLSKDWPVLDMGCGDGTFIKLLEERGYSAIGIDTDSAMIQKCKDENLHVFRTDAISFLKKNKKSFGALICSHLIEHIPFDDLNSFLKKCHEAMYENGLLLIITPNINNLGGSAYFWNDPTHVRPFTIKSLHKLITKNNFKIVRIGYDKDTKIRNKQNLFKFPIDMIRKFLSIIIYGKDGLYTEIVVIAQKT